MNKAKRLLGLIENEDFVSRIATVSGRTAGADILDIVNSAKNIQAEFLKSKGLTWEEVRSWPEDKQKELQKEYSAWLKNRGGA